MSSKANEILGTLVRLGLMTSKAGGGVKPSLSAVKGTNGVTVGIADDTNSIIIPVAGQLLSVTTLAADTADIAPIATNSVIPFPTAIRDDLGLRDPVNLGRIWIPSTAKAIRIIAPVSFNALAAGTYRRLNYNIVINGATVTVAAAAGRPSVYTLGIKPITVAPISGQTSSLCLVSALIDTSTWNAPAALGDSYIELKVQHDTAGADVVTQVGSAFSLEVYS